MRWADKTLMTARVRYRLCMSEREFQSVMRWLRVPKGERPKFVTEKSMCAVTHTFDRYDGRRFCVVCLPFKEKEAALDVVGTLIHEAVHVWQITKAYIEEREPSCEFEAYSIEKIAYELIKEYRDRIQSRLRKLNACPTRRRQSR